QAKQAVHEKADYLAKLEAHFRGMTQEQLYSVEESPWFGKFNYEGQQAVMELLSKVRDATWQPATVEDAYDYEDDFYPDPEEEDDSHFVTNSDGSVEVVEGPDPSEPTYVVNPETDEIEEVDGPWA